MGTPSNSYRRRVAVVCGVGRAGIRTAAATQCNAVNMSWVPRFAVVRNTGTMDITRTTMVSAVQRRGGDVVYHTSSSITNLQASTDVYVTK